MHVCVCVDRGVDSGYLDKGCVDRGVVRGVWTGVCGQGRGMDRGCGPGSGCGQGRCTPPSSRRPVTRLVHPIGVFPK